jgi:hypothetical protein
MEKIYRQKNCLCRKVSFVGFINFKTSFKFNNPQNNMPQTNKKDKIKVINYHYTSMLLATQIATQKIFDVLFVLCRSGCDYCFVVMIAVLFLAVLQIVDPKFNYVHIYIFKWL